MAKFYIEVLAKAQIGFEKSQIVTDKIITTTLIVEGEVIRDKEQIDVYTRYEEFYNYDIAEAEPLANDEFETISYNGNKSDYYASNGYVIHNIVEIFEKEIKFVEE
jgi:hypothetical protein